MPRGRFIDQAKRDKIVELYARGGTRLGIADQLGTTITTVNKVLRENGIALRPPKEPFFTDEAAAAVASRYRAGARIADLAAEFGCTELTVRRVLDKQGVQRRDDRGRARHFTEAEYAAMAEMAEAGKSQNQIAKALNSGVSTIQLAMRQRGIPPARRGAASGAAHGAWKGGRRLHPEGYIMVKVEPSGPYGPMADRHGYVFEHRLAMALHLGRPLTSHETVHHINGIRSDNRVENLQLRKGQHGKGACYRCMDCGSTNVVAVELAEG